MSDTYAWEDDEYNYDEPTLTYDANDQVPLPNKYAKVGDPVWHNGRIVGKVTSVSSEHVTIQITDAALMPYMDYDTPINTFSIEDSDLD